MIQPHERGHKKKERWATGGRETILTATMQPGREIQDISTE